MTLPIDSRRTVLARRRHRGRPAPAGGRCTPHAGGSPPRPSSRRRGWLGLRPTARTWTTGRRGRKARLRAALDLEAARPAQERHLVLTGLTCDKARANGDGAGDHARATSAFLTGAQAARRPAPTSASASRPTRSPRSARRWTRLPSLELGIEGVPRHRQLRQRLLVRLSSTRSPGAMPPRRCRPRSIRGWCSSGCSPHRPDDPEPR